MKNRDKLAGMALYDLLCRMNNALYEEGCTLCVIKQLGVKVMKGFDMRCKHYKTCEDCIAAYLNEEEEKG